MILVVFCFFLTYFHYSCLCKKKQKKKHDECQFRDVLKIYKWCNWKTYNSIINDSDHHQSNTLIEKSVVSVESGEKHLGLTWTLPVLSFSSVSSLRVLVLWAARLSVCERDWWVQERVWKCWVTQESNGAACGFLMLSIVVEGDMFSWGKTPTSPSPTPLSPSCAPHAHADTHTRTRGTLLITLIAGAVQWRGTGHTPCSSL